MVSTSGSGIRREREGQTQGGVGAQAPPLSAEELAIIEGFRLPGFCGPWLQNETMPPPEPEVEAALHALEDVKVGAEIERQGQEQYQGQACADQFRTGERALLETDPRTKNGILYMGQIPLHPPRSKRGFGFQAKRGRGCLCIYHRLLILLSPTCHRRAKMISPT